MRMRVDYSKRFLRQYYKLPIKVQKQFQQRLMLWQDNPSHPQLCLHVLSREYVGMYSINVNGDAWALYTKMGDRHVLFGFIGTHAQLYD